MTFLYDRIGDMLRDAPAAVTGEGTVPDGYLQPGTIMVGAIRKLDELPGLPGDGFSSEDVGLQRYDVLLVDNGEATDLTGHYTVYGAWGGRDMRTWLTTSLMRLLYVKADPQLHTPGLVPQGVTDNQLFVLIADAMNKLGCDVEEWQADFLQTNEMDGWRPRRSER